MDSAFEQVFKTAAVSALWGWNDWDEPIGSTPYGRYIALLYIGSACVIGRRFASKQKARAYLRRNTAGANNRYRGVLRRMDRTRYKVVDAWEIARRNYAASAVVMHTLAREVGRTIRKEAACTPPP